MQTTKSQKCATHLPNYSTKMEQFKVDIHNHYEVLCHHM